MKQINYLSPTSIAMYAQSPDEFYLNYLADNRPPKIAQTKPMSIGSSFDAHAKSYLHEKIFGKGFDPKFELTSIFEQQVEEQNRDWALPNGKYAFEQYKMSGALGDLMLELNTCIGKPRFEFEVRGTVAGRRDSKMVGFGDLILLGKPDVFFINKMGAHVILDWKVNGYCGNRVLSPMQGYVRLRVKSGDKYMNKGQHKNAQLMNHNGMMLNVGGYLEHFDDSWARQLSIYAWLCVSGETWTLTDKGPKQVKNLIGQSSNLIVDGVAYKTEGFFETKTDIVYEIKTKKGYSFQATADHPVMVDYDGQRLWQTVKKLRTGNKIVLHNHKNYSWDGVETYEEGYVLGWLIGDGFFASSGKQHALYFYPDDHHLVNYVTDIIQKNYSITYLEKVNAYRLRSTFLEDLRQNFNLNSDKILSKEIEESSSDFYKGFLTAFFDSDGSVSNKESRIILTQSNYERLVVVQRMLLRLGIVSTIYNEHNHTKHIIEGREVDVKSKYSLQISRENTLWFQERIGFRHSDKKKKLQLQTELRDRTFREDFLVEILEVQEIGTQRVYDVKVPGINAFDANGFYVHNCGEDIGNDFITAIDQLACSPDTFGPGPSIRVAEHRLRVSKQHQTKIFDEAKALWDLCHGDHFFKDLTKEHSDLRCKMLDGTAETLISGSAEDKWFANMSRG